MASDNLEWVEWDVVVAGYWNKAILTPSGISQRLFGMSKDSAVKVEVPMDGLGPYRVRNDGLTVTADFGRLVIKADETTYELMEKALLIGRRAIEQLPETPLFAAGFNFRFQDNNPTSNIYDLLQAPIDEKISETFIIKSRDLTRSLEFNDGRLNLLIQNESSEIKTLFNFHMDSKDRDQLIKWLSIPMSELKSKIEFIFRDVMKISEKKEIL